MRPVKYTRSKVESRRWLKISDPRPVDSLKIMWASAGSGATIGIFLLLFIGFLSIARPILMPMVFATIVSVTLAPASKAAERHGVPLPISAIVLVAAFIGAFAVAAIELASPLSKWIGRAPEIGTTVKTKLAVFDQFLSSLQQLETSLFGSSGSVAANSSPPDVVMPFVDFITPAAGELLLFFITLIFCLVVQTEVRNSIVAMFSDHNAKLRFLKIIKDVERNLAGYLTVVTCINVTIGIIVGLGAWLIGYPSPEMFGILATLLNYVPYIGPATMVVTLFGIGLVSFPSLGHALIGPLAFVALTTTEGNFITPTIVGHRLTLNPMIVIVSLAFWTWIWGPVGTFLAVPLAIIILVIIQHLFPHEAVKLPE